MAAADAAGDGATATVGQSAFTLKGHQAAVWAVLPLGESRLVTASADKSIRVWSVDEGNAGHCLHAIEGAHDDCVRGLAPLGGSMFASCGNDATLRVWDADNMTGGPVQTLVGHSAYVYAVAALRTGELVSVAEDGTARIWRDGACVQTLDFGGQMTVWAVAALEGGEIATGSSDGVVRVFTRNHDMVASEEARAEFAQLKELRNAPEGGGEAIDASELPDIAVGLLQPGGSDGEYRLVNNGGKAEVYGWVAASASWELQGEATGKGGGGGGGGGPPPGEVDGKHYDFVIDVDTEAGMKKLGYNRGENTFLAAQRFLERHQMDHGFVSQIEEFLRANVGDAATAPRVADLGVTAAQGVAAPVAAHFPMRTPLRFGAGDVAKIAAKVRTFTELPHSSSVADVVMGPTPALLAQLVEATEQWPLTKVFPCFDLWRLLLDRNPAAVASQDVVGIALARITEAGSAVSAPLGITSLRMLCNTFVAAGAVRNAMFERLDAVLDAARAAGAANPSNAPLRTALGTLLMNYCTCAEVAADDAMRLAVVAALCDFLASEVASPEAVYRMLVGAGTLLTAGSKDDRDIATQLGLLTSARARESARGNDAKTKESAAQLMRLLEK